MSSTATPHCDVFRDRRGGRRLARADPPGLSTGSVRSDRRERLGMAGLSSATGVGDSVRMAEIRVGPEEPWNGRRPVAIS